MSDKDGNALSSPSKSSNNHVHDEELSALKTHLFYKEDSVFSPSPLHAPTYNMRTWAASTRQMGMGGKSSSKAKKRFQQWDTSYVQEEQDEGSFLNQGPSALIRRRRGVNIRSSHNTLSTIRFFAPGKEGNNMVLDALKRDSEEHVKKRVLPAIETPGGVMPSAFAANLKLDILEPMRQQQEIEFQQRTQLYNPTRKLGWKPRHRGTHSPCVTMDTRSLLAPGVRAPPESLAFDRNLPRPVSPTKTELPAHHRVNYEELHREQEIIKEANTEQEEAYTEALEELERHIADVKESFNSMLAGKFYDVKGERKKGEAALEASLRAGELSPTSYKKQSKKQQRRKIPEFEVSHEEEDEYI